MLLASENEAGHTCPVSMTYSSVPALRKQPDLAREWERHILSARYDPRFRPSNEKSGALIGMAMTEKQGGSDVRANITLAENIEGGQSRSEYLITGHKWFCSAPMCDAFLVLAQALKGLTCFLLPRWTPDGERNRFHIQRLKDKLGNRSNASSRSGIRRRLGAAHRRGGPRRGHHHRNGAAHAAGLRDRLGFLDAAGGSASHSSCAASPGLRTFIDLSAADAECSGGPVSGIRGGDGVDDASGQGL